MSATEDALTHGDIVPDGVRRLRLQPGDRLIVRVTDRWTLTQIREYQDYLRVAFPGNDVLVLVGEEIAVERAANADDETDRLAEKVAERLAVQLRQALPQLGVRMMSR